MNVNREQARKAFQDYAGAFGSENARIALKVGHTYRVAELCERIARSLALAEEDVDLAWLLGLLHDIGRFEQVRRFDSFSDALVDHATLGAQVLFDASEGKPDSGASADANPCHCSRICPPQGESDNESPVRPENETKGSTAAPVQLIRRFVSDRTYDDLIRTAIQTHSAYRLPDGLDQQTRMFCDILRDADKVDILKVNCISPIEDIYRVSEREMVESALSPACVDVFYQHRCIPRGIRRYPADIMLGHICFAWELVFDISLSIAREQGHLHQMLHRTWSTPATQAAFGDMALHMERELGL